MTLPAISVCIPTRNGAQWIPQTIQSALVQDVDLEVVVSDDESTDETVELASATGDPRVRVERAGGRLGMASNWNRSIDLSRGQFVKVLMQDDSLVAGALSVQEALLREHPTAGFAFGPRLLEGDGSSSAEAWIAKYGAPHAAIAGTLPALLPGVEVATALTRGRLRANAVGEPSVVLMRRDVLDRAGPFNSALRQLTDLDLWIRLAAVSDVAFDPRPVARFRVHAKSATARNRQTGRAWLDRLRIVRSLRRNPDTRHLVGPRHYAAAVAAGSLELGRAALTRVGGRR